MANLFDNPFFCDYVEENGERVYARPYVDPETGESFDNVLVPLGWRAWMLNGVAFDGIAPGEICERPEMVRLNMYQFPGDPEDLFGDTSDILKAFRPAPLRFGLEQDVVLVPGERYRMRLRVRPDLVDGYTDEGEKIFPDDVWAAWIRFYVGDTVAPPLSGAEYVASPPFSGMDYSTYNWLVWEFEATEAQAVVGIEITAKWRLFYGNNFFLDEGWLERLTGGDPEPPVGPPDPPPGGVIEWGPQTRAFVTHQVERLIDHFPGGGSESGYPRLPYEKTVLLYHPETEIALLHALIDAMAGVGVRWTLTPSADDAAMGPGLAPHVIALNPSDWTGEPDALAAFFDEHYPQATYEWLLAPSPQDVFVEFARRFGPLPEPPPGVTLFSQRDSRWAGERLGSSYLTIGGSGCAMVSVAMAGTAVEPALTPSVLNARLSANGGYTPGGLLYWAVAGAQIAGLRFLAYPTWRSTPKPPADVARIRAAVARGEFVVVQVDFVPATSALDTHFVLILEDLGDDFLVADPWHGDTVRLLERYGRGTLEASIYAAAFYAREGSPPAPPPAPSPPPAPPPVTPPVDTLVGFHMSPGDMHEQSAALKAVVVYAGEGVQQIPADEARIVVSLRHSWSADLGGAGTIPAPGPARQEFISRCVQIIRQNPHVWGWAIGNEANNPREDPEHYVIGPEDVVTVYNAIRAQCPGARLSPGATDPYNAVKMDSGQWAAAVWERITGAEWIEAHGYVRGPDPDLVGSPARFNDPPLQWLRLNFPGAVVDLLDRLPLWTAGLPTYVTECNHIWRTAEPDWGWVDDERAIQVIRRCKEQAREAGLAGLAFYRWKGDEWRLHDKPALVAAVVA